MGTAQHFPEQYSKLLIPKTISRQCFFERKFQNSLQTMARYFGIYCYKTTFVYWRRNSFFPRAGLSAPIYHVTPALVNPFHCSCVLLVVATSSRVSTGTNPSDLLDTRGYCTSFMLPVSLTHTPIKSLTYLSDTSMQPNSKIIK